MTQDTIEFVAASIKPKEERIAVAIPSPPLIPLELPERRSTPHGEKTGPGVSGAREPPASMQAILLELSAKAKARQEQTMAETVTESR